MTEAELVEELKEKAYYLRELAALVAAHRVELDAQRIAWGVAECVTRFGTLTVGQQNTRCANAGLADGCTAVSVCQ